MLTEWCQEQAEAPTYEGRDSLIQSALRAAKEGAARGVEDFGGADAPTIIELMEAPEWFGSWFEGESWDGWKAFLAGVFGLPMTPARLALWRACTQRETAPSQPADEAWMVVGRRGGKSRIASFVAVYLACFRDYRKQLSPGEWATIPVISADAKESRTIMRYVKAFLDHPRLKKKVVKPLTESVELVGRVQIEVHVARFKAVRSYTVAAVICDEIAFWETSEDSANPDSEVLTALRPALATITGSVLMGLSSPYARAGVLWEMYSEHFGKDDPEVVWQADTGTMHPHDPLSRLGREIAKAYERDPDAAGAEYGAQFRTDLEKFISEEAIKEAVVPERVELPPVSGIKYLGFVDPSGGTVDSMTLGIAHTQGATAVLDCLREVRPPFSPKAIAKEFADVLKTYGLTRVTGDRYGGEWPRERFREESIWYELAEKPKSEIYLDFLSSMNSCQIELLDNPRLLVQLRGLERRRGRGGRDIVDHPPKSHDDVINAAAGALGMALPATPTMHHLAWEGDSMGDKNDKEQYKRDLEKSPDGQQLKMAMPEVDNRPPPGVVCGNCIWRGLGKDDKPWCGLRLFKIRDADPGCENHDMVIGG